MITKSEEWKLFKEGYLAGKQDGSVIFSSLREENEYVNAAWNMRNFKIIKEAFLNDVSGMSDVTELTNLYLALSLGDKSEEWKVKYVLERLKVFTKI